MTTTLCQSRLFLSGQVLRIGPEIIIKLSSRFDHTDVHLFIDMLSLIQTDVHIFFFSSGRDGPPNASPGQQQQPATPLLILQSTPRHSTAGGAPRGGRTHRLLDATGRPRGNRSAADGLQVPRGCGAVSAAAAAPHPAMGRRRSGNNKGWRPPPIEYRRRYSCSEKLADEKEERGNLDVRVFILQRGLLPPPIECRRWYSCSEKLDDEKERRFRY